MELLIFLGIVFISALAVPYFLYVSVIKKRNKVMEAIAGIDVQLKKRHNVIPNILTIAKKFMEHERSLLEDITKLRTEALEKISSGDIDQKFDIEKQLENKLSKFVVAAENYPQLKSDQTMVQAMRTYNEVEGHLAAARRFYNSAAAELKNAVEIFPSSVIASMLNIKEVPFFEVDEAIKAPIDVNSYL